jgi:Fe-S cluster assembly ATP-binding protein
MLDIIDLQVEISGERILNGVTLTIDAGETHAVMGPNGSGKSTLANVIAGKPGYDVVHGEIIFEGIDLLALSADQRAREGIFLAFQYPVELPGVRNRQF